MRTRKQLVYCLLCGLLFQSCLRAYGDTKHPVTLQDLLNLKEASYTQQLSPDGSALAYTLNADESLWLISTRPHSSPKKIADGVLPLWAPRGKQLAFYSDRTGTFQLWVLDLQSGVQEQITNLPAGIDPFLRTPGLGVFFNALRYAWSPDSRKLVFTSQVSVKGPPSSSEQPDPAQPREAIDDSHPLVLSNETPPEWTTQGIYTKAFPKSRAWAFWERKNKTNSNQGPSIPTRNQLFTVDVRSKEIQQLTDDDFGCFEPDWSPDGGSIVCASTEGRDMATFADASNIYVIDVTTRVRIALSSGPSTKWMPSWSPDGRNIAYAASLRWGARNVYVTSLVDRKTINVTSELHRSIVEFVWSPDSRVLVIGFADGLSVLSIAQVDVLHPGVVVHLNQGPASRSAITISRSGAIAWRQSDGSSSQGIRILPNGGKSSYRLLDFDPEVAEWQLGTQEVLQWRNHRKDELEGVVIKPPGFEQGKRYPLIVDAYPVHVNGFMASPMGGNQAWASAGYVVFLPISRAPHFQVGDIKSESFTRAAKGPNGWDVTLDDVMSGVDELIRKGIVDPDRMGLYGFSNGGGTVNYLVTRTNRFKCAVSVAGAMSDWVRQSLMSTDSRITDFEGGTSLWDDPTAYVKLSAVFHLNKVTTPMLLADGDEDGNFLLDTLEMYSSLRQLGRKVTLIRYPNQSHGFSGPALADFWVRELAFFGKFLKSKTSTELPNGYTNHFSNQISRSLQ